MFDMVKNTKQNSSRAKVRALLRSEEIKQTELAEALGITPSTFSIKLNKNGFTLRDISRIADYFDVSTDWLLGRTEQQKLPEKATK